jgi:hypothetical protein
MQVTSTSPPAALGSARRTAAGAMGIFLLVIGVVGIV